MSRANSLTRKKILVIAGALAGIGGCMTDILGTFILGAQSEGYNSLTSTMSQLGVPSDPVATRIRVCWIAMGLLLTFFGATFGIAFTKRKTRALLAGGFLMLYGVGEGLGSAIFPADKAGTVYTSIGLFHSIAGSIGVAALILFPVIMIKIRPGLRSLYQITFYTGLAFVILFGLGRMAVSQEHAIGLFKGLWQRIYMLIYYLGIIVTACTVLYDQFKKHPEMQ